MIVENNLHFHEQDESFTNRRLSDLLPVEFIHQIGLDPNQYIFDQMLATDVKAFVRALIQVFLSYTQIKVRKDEIHQ